MYIATLRKRCAEFCNILELILVRTRWNRATASTKRAIRRQWNFLGGKTVNKLLKDLNPTDLDFPEGAQLFINDSLIPITGDFETNVKNYGSIKKYFRFLPLMVHFSWSLSKMVPTTVSPILIIWKVFSGKKILPCLVYSILVLIYIFFYISFVVFKSNFGSCQFLERFLINFSIDFLINFLINFSIINFLMTTSYNCFWTSSQFTINYCLLLPVTIKCKIVIKSNNISIPACILYSYFNKFAIDIFF